MIKWETIKAGDELWDYHSERAGNTTMRRWCNWPVAIVEINHAENFAVVRWNGNPPKKWYRHQVVKLRRTEGKERGW